MPDSQYLSQIALDALDFSAELARREKEQNKTLFFASSKKENKDNDNITAEQLCAKRSPLAWLLELTSNKTLGQRLWDEDEKKYIPKHILTKEEVFKTLDPARAVKFFRPEMRFDKSKLKAHKVGDLTFYWSGADEDNQPFCLVKIDIDCDKNGSGIGSLKGALAFAQYLSDNHFANLYFEPSTNGKGVHAYFILDRQVWTEHRLEKNKRNKAHLTRNGLIADVLLNQVQPWLNELAKKVNADIEFVEIKGIAPDPHWKYYKGHNGGKGYRELQYFKAGSLAKVPDGIIDRFDELKNTTFKQLDSFFDLPYVENFTIEKMVHQRQLQSTLSDCPNADQVAYRATGSFTGCLFNDKTLNGLNESGKYHSVALSLMEALEKSKLKTSGKTKATVEDLAIFLMIGEFVSKNMLPDGSLPFKRFKHLWLSLINAGDIQRSWNANRYAACRGAVDQLNLINWTDRAFVVGKKLDNGKVINGQACKWRFDAALMQMLKTFDKKTVNKDYVSESLNAKSVGIIQLYVKPILTKHLEKHPIKDFSEIIKPYEVEILTMQPKYDHSPDELSDIITSIAA